MQYRTVYYAMYNIYRKTGRRLKKYIKERNKRLNRRKGKQIVRDIDKEY